MSQALTSSTPPLDALCIGGVNLDRKLKALSNLQQGSSNPCLALESAGGVARNVAENLARLGVSVGLIGQFGQDCAAQTLLSGLRSLGVDTRACTLVEAGSTGSYTALLDSQGRLVMGMADMALTDALDPDRLAAGLALLPSRLWMADLNLPADSLAWLATQARQRRMPFVVVAVSEPKMQRLPQDLHGIDLLLCNRGELASICPLSIRDDDPRHGLQQAYAALSERGLRQLLVTQGAQGV